jgi:hypothetical protein
LKRGVLLVVKTGNKWVWSDEDGEIQSTSVCIALFVRAPVCIPRQHHVTNAGSKPA